jgi:hypothetical protein
MIWQFGNISADMGGSGIGGNTAQAKSGSEVLQFHNISTEPRRPDSRTSS